MQRSGALAFSAAASIAALAATPAPAQHLDPTDKRSVTTVAVAGAPAAACYEAALSSLTAARPGYAAIALSSCNAALAGELLEADRTATLVNRAIIRRARGDLDGAVADLEAALARDPALQAAHLTIGGVYARLERWSEAEAALSRGIALGPEAAAAEDYFTRAGAREELGDVAGAFADYTAAAALAPEWEAPRRELERFEVVPARAGDGS